MTHHTWEKRLMVKMIAWNIAQCTDARRLLLEWDADIALIQEAKEPPSDLAARVTVDANPWQIGSFDFGLPSSYQTAPRLNGSTRNLWLKQTMVISQ
jgi:hypothetical protein